MFNLRGSPWIIFRKQLHWRPSNANSVTRYYITALATLVRSFHDLTRGDEGGNVTGWSHVVASFLGHTVIVVVGPLTTYPQPTSGLYFNPLLPGFLLFLFISLYRCINLDWP